MMRTNKTAAIGGCMAVLMAGAGAQAASVVAPNANANDQGGLQTPTPLRRGATFIGDGTGGAHNQIVYSSDFFDGSSGSLNISSLSFRAAFSGAPTSISVPDTTFRLSTTSAAEGSLSSTFADNLGSDAQTVFSGALSLNSTVTQNADGTFPFDYTVNFDTPFSYDPSQGNLLLDVAIPTDAVVVENAGTFGTVAFDSANVEGDGLASVTNLTDGTSATGNVGTSGAVAQFTFNTNGGGGGNPVPTPTAAAAGLALLGGLFIRRRRAA